MNKNKSMKLSSKDIIIARDNICKTKTKYWRIIRSENVISKKAKAAGMGSGFDLTQLHNEILQMSNTLIKIKLMLNAINNGIKEFNFEEAKKTHYYTIYAACEKKSNLHIGKRFSRRVQLIQLQKQKLEQRVLEK